MSNGKALNAQVKSSNATKDSQRAVDVSSAEPIGLTGFFVPLFPKPLGQLVVLVDDVDGVEAGREGCIMGMRDDMVTVGCQSRDRLRLVLAHLAGSASGALPPFEREGRGVNE